jgi:hypothetical protein
VVSVLTGFASSMAFVNHFACRLTFGFFTWGIYLDLLRSCFEALVIYEFFSLLLSYLGDNEAEQLHMISNHSERVAYPFPFCCWYLYPADNARLFLRDCKLTILQYVVIRPCTMVLAIIFESVGMLRTSSLELRYANIWLTGIK